ncbi:hypothetical protein B0H17DRAFT_1141600 [Mycena rosella]|uniref:Uncharacterized protein n=1 Tax=Mycena rosella TaxID=1033263 RepID=A0AAD7G6H9_MYCRO|nr:hypothetical protein B0H17DRAFT_1141600 [Mycena rosella]
MPQHSDAPQHPPQAHLRRPRLHRRGLPQYPDPPAHLKLADDDPPPSTCSTRPSPVNLRSPAFGEAIFPATSITASCRTRYQLRAQPVPRRATNATPGSTSIAQSPNQLRQWDHFLLRPLKLLSLRAFAFKLNLAITRSNQSTRTINCPQPNDSTAFCAGQSRYYSLNHDAAINDITCEYQSDAAAITGARQLAASTQRDDSLKANFLLVLPVSFSATTFAVRRTTVALRAVLEIISGFSDFEALGCHFDRIPPTRPTSTDFAFARPNPRRPPAFFFFFNPTHCRPSAAYPEIDLDPLGLVAKRGPRVWAWRGPHQCGIAAKTHKEADLASLGSWLLFWDARMNGFRIERSRVVFETLAVAARRR